MIELEHIRHHNEKLKSVLEPHLGEGDWIYALSGWHPSPNQKMAAVAETAGWGLVLFKTKQTECIYRARALFAQLLKLQDEKGLFPRYLHEVHLKSCVVSSYRIFLVISTLLKWHEQALGVALKAQLQEAMDKMMSCEEFVEVVAQAQKPAVLQPAVMPSWLARYLWAVHVLEIALDKQLAKTLEELDSLQGMNWLEKPKGLLPGEVCWLDIWRSIDAFSSECPPKVGLAHLWTCLLHAEGTRLPLGSSKREWSCQFRALPLAREKRGLTQSCFLSIKSDQDVDVRAFATFAEIQGTSNVFRVSYDPQAGVGSLEDEPWIELVTSGDHRWLFNETIFSALKQLPGQTLKLKLAGSHLELQIKGTGLGHLRQKPSHRQSGALAQTLYFIPADVKAIGVLEISLKTLEMPSCLKN